MISQESWSPVECEGTSTGCSVSFPYSPTVVSRLYNLVVQGHIVQGVVKRHVKSVYSSQMSISSPFWREFFNLELPEHSAASFHVEMVHLWGNCYTKVAFIYTESSLPTFVINKETIRC